MCFCGRQNSPIHFASHGTVSSSTPDFLPHSYPCRFITQRSRSVRKTLLETPSESPINTDFCLPGFGVHKINVLLTPVVNWADSLRLAKLSIGGLKTAMRPCAQRESGALTKGHIACYSEWGCGSRGAFPSPQFAAPWGRIRDSLEESQDSLSCLISLSQRSQTGLSQDLELGQVGHLLGDVGVADLGLRSGQVLNLALDDVNRDR